MGPQNLSLCPTATSPPVLQSRYRSSMTRRISREYTSSSLHTISCCSSYTRTNFWRCTEARCSQLHQQPLCMPCASCTNNRGQQSTPFRSTRKMGPPGCWVQLQYRRRIWLSVNRKELVPRPRVLPRRLVLLHFMPRYTTEQIIWNDL